MIDSFNLFITVSELCTRQYSDYSTAANFLFSYSNNIPKPKKYWINFKQDYLKFYISGLGNRTIGLGRRLFRK